MDSGVFIVSHQIYSSAVHVIMMLALAPHRRLLYFCVLFKGIIMPAYSISICPLGAPLADWRKCFCVVIWLGVGGDIRRNDPCWEVLQEQIWRRYPVNKEPAETSCEQHRSEMCDFKQGPPVPDSWWSAYHFLFLLLLNMTVKEN